MNLALLPLIDSPQVLLASQVLRALEHGDLPMHARDYRETAAWVRDELRKLDGSMLQQLLWRAPAPLVGAVENLLHEQGTASWCPDAAAASRAKAAFELLLKRR